MSKQPAVYIMANKRNGTIYTGVTSNSQRRVYEHKHGITGGFTARYGCKMLVYFALFDTMDDAILEEKRIKAGSRRKKMERIEAMNSDWHDLYESIVE